VVKFPRTEVRLRQLVRERDRLEEDLSATQSLSARSSLDDVIEEIYELEYLFVVALIHRWAQIILPILMIGALAYGVVLWAI
jgi:hypothetical protein